MTNGEAPTTADYGQAPATAATPENAAAAMAPAEQPVYGRLNAAEQAALAAAASEAFIPAEGEAAANVAEAQPEAPAQADADPVKKKEDEDADSEEELVDLAMASEADIFDAIAAADGAREVSGEEGEASALGGDSGGAPILAVLAVAAAGAGLYFALDGGDDNDLDPTPEPEPEPDNVAPVITSAAAVSVDENVAVDTVVLDVNATDADDDDITYSILAEGDDAAAFEIDPETGEVRFIASPDFETQDSYSFTVVATDSEGNATEQDVVVTINDIDDEATVVSLDDADDDNNDLTPALVDAADDDFFFTDDAAVASNTIILNFEEGDSIQFSEGAEVSFTTGADDANDLEITVNEGGVVSIILLDDVLADDVGFIFDEETAEEAVGFDFISVAEPVVVAVAEDTFA